MFKVFIDDCIYIIIIMASAGRGEEWQSFLGASVCSVRFHVHPIVFRACCVGICIVN